MVSLVAEIKEGRAEMNCRAAVQQFAGRCGGGVSKPALLQDGDGTDDRTGWPAVIRGRREQYRSSSSVGVVRSSSSVFVSGSPVKASAAGARAGRFGSGVLSQSRCRTGDGAGCRRVAVLKATSSSQDPAVCSSPSVSDWFRGKERRIQAPSGSPGRKSWARVPQDIDSEVVSGQATAIPATPASVRPGLRKQQADAVIGSADGVAVPSGPWCHTAPGPLHAFHREVQ